MVSTAANLPDLAYFDGFCQTFEGLCSVQINYPERGYWISTSPEAIGPLVICDVYTAGETLNRASFLKPFQRITHN